MTIALADNWNPQSPLFSNNIEFLKRASKSGRAQAPPAPPSEPPLHLQFEPQFTDIEMKYKRK